MFSIQIKKCECCGKIYNAARYSNESCPYCSWGLDVESIKKYLDKSIYTELKVRMSDKLINRKFVKTMKKAEKEGRI